MKKYDVVRLLSYRPLEPLGLVYCARSYGVIPTAGDEYYVFQDVKANDTTITLKGEGEDMHGLKRFTVPLDQVELTRKFNIKKHE